MGHCHCEEAVADEAIQSSGYTTTLWIATPASGLAMTISPLFEECFKEKWKCPNFGPPNISLVEQVY